MLIIQISSVEKLVMVNAYGQILVIVGSEQQVFLYSNFMGVNAGYQATNAESSNFIGYQVFKQLLIIQTLLVSRL
jgi:hypothetical protein